METVTTYRRLRELDFLRGLAIIFVLCRHQQLFQFTSNMGWTGVDLFFVLSGFLVSGLLFKEYRKYGSIRPKLFLIRRGFKIYPLYYLTYIIYIVPLILNHKFQWKGFISDLLFVQNYTLGFGYAYGASWSLAVEEHFYFGFALLLFIGIKSGFVSLKNDHTDKISRLEIAILTAFVICLALRLVSYGYLPTLKSYSMTHLRIDSLLAGVFISYQYYYRKEAFIAFVNKYHKGLLLLALALLSFIPFMNPLHSQFVITYGFSMVWAGYAIVLAYFLTAPDINEKLNGIFTTFVVNGVSKIGVASYSIYIIHSFVNYVIDAFHRHYFDETIHHRIIFFVTSVISVFVGILMTNHLEKYFLGLRDKWFPNRIN